jgi:hypothetical protein
MREKGHGCSKAKLLLPFAVLFLKQDSKVVAKKRQQIRKESVVEIRDVLSSKTSKVEGKAVEQADTQGVKERVEEKGGFTKNSKTWAQVISNYANMEKEANNQRDSMQDREHKERQVREANIIIKGVKDYGKNECTLDLASDVLKDTLLWQGRICQVWRVGKPGNERARPIKVIMSSTRDKQILLGKKQLLRGSRFFLDEDLTIRQQEKRREDMSKVREARDEGKSAWLFKSKVVISFFGTLSKTGQQGGSQEARANLLTVNYATRPVWANRGEDSTLSLVGQNKYVMIPSHYARIITVLVSFETFSGCGFSSNTLLNYLFRCVYLLNGLLISALGFTDVFI